MFRTTLAAAAAVALLFAGSASAQKIDANGKCHDASGKFAKAEVCGGSSAKTASAATSSAKSASATTATKTASAKPAKPAPAATAAATPAAATAKAAPTKCKNDKGKYAKCGSPGAHPA